MPLWKYQGTINEIVCQFSTAYQNLFPLLQNVVKKIEGVGTSRDEKTATEGRNQPEWSHRCTRTI